MAKLTFYRKAGTGNYYLTRCESEAQDISITLPDYICHDGINYTYGIYSYAFWGNSITTHVKIPETVDALNTQCFAGSNIQFVELLMRRPPRRPESFEELTSLADCITFMYPMDCRIAYENRGWIDYYINDQLRVKIKENRTVEDKERTHYPSLYRAGTTVDQVIFSTKTNAIDPMAFLGTRQSVENASQPMFIFNDNSYNNISYELKNGRDIIDQRNGNNILIKGSYEIDSEENPVATINSSVLSSNCFYNNPILSNARTVVPLQINFTGQRIEDLAFQNCRGLGKLTVKDDIEYIARNAFWGCQSLSSISITPTGTEHQKYYNKSIQAFDLDNLLYKITDEDKMDPIWFSAATIINVTIPEGATKLPQFYEDLLSQIDEIPPYLFKNSGLTGVLTIPSNIKKIGKHAFQNCQGLTGVICAERPDGSKLIIDEYAFYGCANITVFRYPDTGIEAGARALSFEGVQNNE